MTTQGGEVRAALLRVTKLRPDLRHDFLQRRALAERAVETGVWPEQVEAPKAPKHLGLDHSEGLRADRTMRELRERGLTDRAICTVLDLYEGWQVTPDQVRYWRDKLGLPKMASKARAMREQHAAGRR